MNAAEIRYRRLMETPEEIRDHEYKYRPESFNLSFREKKVILGFLNSDGFSGLDKF